MALDPALQELVDKAAIRDLMARYARGIDRPDFDLIASSFTPDVDAKYGRWEAHGRDDIVNKLRPGISRTDSSTHFMGDQQFQFNGDIADVETYAIIYILYTLDSTQYQSMSGIHYEDKMVRIDSGGKSNAGSCTAIGGAVPGWTPRFPASTRCRSPHREVGEIDRNRASAYNYRRSNSWTDETMIAFVKEAERAMNNG